MKKQKDEEVKRQAEYEAQTEQERFKYEKVLEQINDTNRKNAEVIEISSSSISKLQNTLIDLKTFDQKFQDFHNEFK